MKLKCKHKEMYNEIFFYCVCLKMQIQFIDFHHGISHHHGTANQQSADLYLPVPLNRTLCRCIGGSGIEPIVKLKCILITQGFIAIPSFAINVLYIKVLINL